MTKICRWFSIGPVLHATALKYALVMCLATPLTLLQGEAVIAAPAQDSSSTSLSLEHVIRAVVSHNDLVTAARFMAEAAASREKPAGAWDDPMLMVGVNNLPTSLNFSEDMMTMTMVGLSQNIPYAGDRGLQGKAARAEADAAFEDARATELDLVTAARIAHAEYYYRQRILADRESQKQILSDVIRSVEAAVRSNRAGQEDLSAAQAELWRAEERVLSAAQDVDAARYNLNALMGNEPGTTLPPAAAPDMASPDSVSSWEDAARAYYPPLKRLEQMSLSSSFAADAADRMRWPMLNLYASYGFRQDAPTGEPRRDMISFGANLSLPVFSGRRQGDMAASMQMMQQRYDSEASQLWREVRARLWTLHARATRLSTSLDLYTQRIIPAAEDAFRSAFAGYAADRTSFIALLTYAVSIYSDRVMADEIALDLAKTLSEARRYTTDPQAWARYSSSSPDGTTGNGE